MTAYDKAEALRLLAELREDDAGMHPAPWVADWLIDRDAARLARLRNNAQPIADQLEAAAAAIDDMLRSGEHDWKLLGEIRADRDQWSAAHRALTAALRAEFETDDPAEIIATMRMVIKERDDLQGDRDRWRARAQVAELELTAMRPVVDAADGSYGSQRGGHFGQPHPTHAMTELADAIDVYRSTADARADAIAKIAGDAPAEGESHG